MLTPSLVRAERRTASRSSSHEDNHRDSVPFSVPRIRQRAGTIAADERFSRFGWLLTVAAVVRFEGQRRSCLPVWSSRVGSASGATVHNSDLPEALSRRENLDLFNDVRLCLADSPLRWRSAVQHPAVLLLTCDSPRKSNKFSTCSWTAASGPIWRSACMSPGRR